MGSDPAMRCTPVLVGSRLGSRSESTMAVEISGATEPSLDQCSAPWASNTLRLFMRGSSARNSWA